MKNLNIKEASELHSILYLHEATELTLVEFLQDYVDTYKDDWYMYRPIVRKLESDVIDLLKRVSELENINS